MYYYDSEGFIKFVIIVASLLSFSCSRLITSERKIASYGGEIACSLSKDYMNPTPMISNTMYFGIYKFNVTPLESSSTLLLVIANKKDDKILARATSPIPTEGQIANLSIVTPDGAYSISCK